MRYQFPILAGITLLSVVGVVWSQDDSIQDDNGDGFLDFAEGDTIYARDINANFEYASDHIHRFENAFTITSDVNVGIVGSVTATGFTGDGASLNNLSANNLTTGTIATARLGTGTADGSSFLRGDGTWVTPTTFGVAGSGSANYVPLFTDGTTLGNSAIYQSNGNVGIGTTGPASRLHITHSEDTVYDATQQQFSGTSMVLANTSEIEGTFAQIAFFNRGSSSGETRIISVGRGANSSDLAFVTEYGAKSEKLRILGNGNVGIGTAAPGSKLAISGGATIGSSYAASLAPANGMVIEGNVGIGIANPAYKLHLMGTMATYLDAGEVSNPFEGLTLSNTTGVNYGTASPSILFDSGGGGGRARIYSRRLGASGGILVFDTDTTSAVTTERMRIDEFGNVGIGTTSPVEKLDVAGTIIADAVIEDSDQRLKWDISPLEHASDIIHCLQGVTYRWTDPEAAQSRQIGLIAQDAELCLPEAVHTDTEGYKSVAYSRLVVPLIQTAQEMQQALDMEQVVNAAQQKQIQTQQGQIHAQERQIRSQKKTMDDLADRVRHLENLLQKR